MCDRSASADAGRDDDLTVGGDAQLAPQRGEPALNGSGRVAEPGPDVSNGGTPSQKRE